MPLWLYTTLLGMGTVFVGLCLLVLITMLLSRIVQSADARKKAQEVPAQTAEAQARQDDDIADRGAFAAAVAASVATVMGADVSGIRIVSIKRIA